MFTSQNVRKVAIVVSNPLTLKRKNLVRLIKLSPCVSFSCLKLWESTGCFPILIGKRVVSLTTEAKPAVCRFS